MLNFSPCSSSASTLAVFNINFYKLWSNKNLAGASTFEEKWEGPRNSKRSCFAAAR